MKKIIEFFIYYTVPLNLIVLGVIIFGIIGMQNLKTTFFPQYESNIITINLVYPGASPAQVEEGAVTKIEKKLRGLKGVDRITSKSYENFGSIVVELKNSSDAPEALQDIKNRVDGIISFPKEMENPIISILDVTDYAMIFALSGENVDLLTLKKIAQNIEADLVNKEEISQVALTGFPNEEIEIAVSEANLRTFSLTFQEIAMAVSANNLTVTGGTILSDEEDYSIRINNKGYYAAELENIIVKTTLQGNIIRLKDVATVRDKFVSSANKIDVSGNPAVVITVGCTNSEDFVSIANELNAYIANFNSTNNTVHLEILEDRAIELKERTKLFVDNGIMSLFLVLFVLGIFLRFRIAIWVAFGLFAAVVGFFAVGSFFNVTINMISLFGMIVVVGLLVDDGVVISENIYLHTLQGKSRRQAVIDGTMEVFPGVFSGVLTTIIAFSVFFFIGGNVGNYFSEMAVVVIVTLVISMFEAFFVLPSHIAHSKVLDPDSKPTFINNYADKAIDFTVQKIYQPIIKYFIAMPFVCAALFAGLIIITFGALKGGIIKQDFFPKISSNTVDVLVALPEGSSQKMTDSILVFIEEELWLTSKDFMEDTVKNGKPIKFIERRLGPGTNKGSLRAYMLDAKKRSYTTDDFIATLRKNVGNIPECETLQFESLTNFVGEPIAIALVGNEKEELVKASARLQALLAEDERLVDIADDNREGLKEIKLTLKPNAYLLHFNYQNVIQQVRSGFYGLDVQNIQRGNDEIKVVVRYDEHSRSSIKNLDDMWIKSPTGASVPLSEIATYTIERGELSISHLDGQKAITVTADLASSSYTSRVVLEEIEANIMPIFQNEFPAVGVSYEGQSRVTAAISKTGGPAALIALIFILLSISLTFRTYTKALLFLPVIAMSFVGVAWGHYIMGINLTMVSFFGLVTLIGMQVNDGLVLMEKFNINIKSNMPFKTALTEACISRFRPIFLTTITTVAGLFPLMMQSRTGSEVVYPIAVSIVFGISFVTVITLTFLPILLMTHNALKRCLHWLISGNWVPAEQVERAYIEKKTVEKFQD
jgi:multidrug efflux pump subunit AcrB